MADQDFIAGHPDSALPHVGSYRRVLPVSLERLYENVLDWEHLPHVHRSSFGAVRCLADGPWGWRASVTDSRGRASELELNLDRRSRRWISRVAHGAGSGAEIWTHAVPAGAARTDIVVDFFVPGVQPAQRPAVGHAYAGYYARLYDEDVQMMLERQRQLDRRVHRAPEDAIVVLGRRADLRLPREVVVSGRDYLLTVVEGTLAVVPRQCPHQLGPLQVEGLDGSAVVCPWHGARFDVFTGENLSGRGCRLHHLPRVVLDRDDYVILVAT